MDVPRPDPGADRVLLNAQIFRPGRPRGEPGSVAIGGGRILRVGPADSVRPLIGPGTEVLDLDGRLLLPGFHDSHFHPLLGGMALVECNLIGCLTLEACLKAIQAYATSHPAMPFVRGGGWSYSAFGPKGPHKGDLDRLIPDRPATLKAIDGHSLWVNSKALDLAGITAATPDPPGGAIERDAATGEPAGTLREWSAMDLVTNRLPPPSPDTILAGGRAFLDQARRLGITSVYEAMATTPLLEAYAALEKRGELSTRVSAAILCEPGDPRKALEHAIALRTQFATRLIRPMAAKFFLDGVIDAHTAWLLEPYADRPGFRSAPIWPEPEFLDTVCAMDREGFQVHVHAVGDAAVRLALDAFDLAIRRNGRRDSRHQIAHLDVLHDADLPRFAALGVTVNVQPSWFFIDSVFIDSQLPSLGPARAEKLYRMRELIDSGATVTCGSDWPFGGDQLTLNPLDSIQVGATREAVQPDLAARPLPGSPVGLAELLDCYMSRAAFASFQEQVTGSIEAGKMADLIVLDRNVFEIPLAEIHTARVLLTLFEGEPVFRSLSM